MLAYASSGIEIHGEGWQNLVSLWLTIAAVFVALSIFFNRFPVSFPGRARPRKGNPQPTQNPRSQVLTGQLTSSLRAPDERKPRLLSNGTREKRASLRRKGKPVRVLMADAETTQEPTTGWVLDRSRGGLYLVVSEPVAVGTMLSVRATHAPDTMPWVQVEIRRCHPKGNRWGLGCRFKRELAWGELLLFG